MASFKVAFSTAVVSSSAGTASSTGIAPVAAVAMASPEVRLLAGPTSSEKFGFARGEVTAIKPRLLSSDT
uniref:Uncharacterized protein n=1 Tax=Bionectria ochroleuca TaxID=29856 RepID=A0A8H7N0Q1_BIOOC